MKEYFTTEYLTKVWEMIFKWAIYELPVIIGLILGLIITLKIIKASVKRLKKTLIHRAEKNEDTDTAEAEKRINTLTSILYGFIKIILVVTVLMIILQKFGINIGPILASAGILGLAVGFGAQELVRDFISGFFMLLENQVRTGDVATINGTGGVVEHIALRTITLRDFSGVVHIFQNGKISTLANSTKEWSAAVFNISVAYKEKVHDVVEIMKQVGESLQSDPEFGEKIINPLEIFGLDQFAASAIVIKARMKTKPGNQWAIMREYNKRIKEAFDENGIEIPFPHTKIITDSKTWPIEAKSQDGKSA
jgi:small-conductance mechanosensitive channel